MFKSINCKNINKIIIVYYVGSLLLFVSIVGLLLLAHKRHLTTLEQIVVGITLISSMVFVYAIIKFLKGIFVFFDRNFGKSNMIFQYVEFDTLQKSYEVLKKSLEEKMSLVSNSKVKLLELESEKNQLNEALDDINESIKRSEIKLEHQLNVFQKLTDQLNYRIWKTDMDGNICFSNEMFKLHFLNRGTIKSVYDVLDISDGTFDLFTKRDFGEILLKFKDDPACERLIGRTKRLFYRGSLKKVLFVSANSSYDVKMSQNYLKKSRELYIMHEIGRIVSGKSSIEIMLQEALKKISYLQNLYLCTVRLVNDQSELELIATNGIANSFTVERNLARKNTHLARAFSNNRLLVINKMDDMVFEDSDVARIIDSGYKVAYIPLSNYNKSFGIMSIVSEFDFTSDHLMLLESISINITIALEKILLYDQLKANYFKTVEAFVTATEIKAERFSGHSRRVAEMCKRIAQKMYLSDAEVDEIYIAGLLHDVGKLAFSDNSIDHYVDINKHGLLGRNMIQNVGLNNDILDGIEFHHINYNLSNLSNSEMTEQPFYAQIIKIANDLDLAISNTNNLCTPEEFILKMMPYSGVFYSPQLFRILESIIYEMKVD